MHRNEKTFEVIDWFVIDKEEILVERKTVNKAEMHYTFGFF